MTFRDFLNDNQDKERLFKLERHDELYGKVMYVGKDYVIIKTIDMTYIIPIKNIVWIR